MNLFADISAAQLLDTGAMRFVETALSANAHGAPPIGPAALVAIDEVQRSIGTDDNLRAQTAEALKALQIIAVLFTVQLTAGTGDRARLQELEEKLVERLEDRGAVHVIHAYDDGTSSRLHVRALDYARQIVMAEETNAPIGSPAVERSINDLRIAAATFTMELARAEGRDPKELRRIGKFLKTLAGQAPS